MRVLIATVQVPFIRGGGEILAEQLQAALRGQGHAAEILAMPFRHGPAAALRRDIALWRDYPLDRFDAGPVDRVIHLKFPCWYARSDRAVVWMLHQHRAYYELWPRVRDHLGADAAETERLRAEVIAADTAALAAIPRRYTISRRVSERLAQFNGVSSEPILHPPAHPERYYGAAAERFIFCPSRLEDLKRQELLVRAMAMTRAPVVALLAGEGGARARLEALIAELGVGGRVRLLGRVDDDTMRALYARCLAVFFAPFDEDYGYVTLEAMLSSKPVLTCSDSGGPLSFVRDGATGRVLPPSPEAVADAIDALAADPARAAALGRAARADYDERGIGWGPVLERLLA